MADAFLEAIENLSRSHREHEKFYAQQPREQAVTLQRHSRSLCALADRWATVAPMRREVLNPYEGADDLNAAEAIQLAGILFMEGEGEPAEITRIRNELRTVGDGSITIGAWLGTAMESTWAAASALLGYPSLTDLLGDRHRIIANDWQAASMSSLAGQLLQRSAEILETIDFSPSALRADLDGDRVTPRTLYSAVELIDHAADLLSDSAGLVHDNERRWRGFHRRIAELTQEEQVREPGSAQQ